MKNYSKEFYLKNLYITVGTHWEDWSLPLRIRWQKWHKGNVRTADILIDIFCFTILIELFGGIK